MTDQTCPLCQGDDDLKVDTSNWPICGSCGLQKAHWPAVASLRRELDETRRELDEAASKVGARYFNQRRLAALAECDRLREQNERLRRELDETQNELAATPNYT